MAQTKALNTFQQTILSMTEDARDATFRLITLFLKNECINNEHNMVQRDQVVNLYNFFADSKSNFWPTLYSKHSTNFMLKKVIDFVSSPTMSIQDICIGNSVDTSSEYLQTFCVERPYLPFDPRPTGVTWYDYLHPKAEKMSKEAFVNILKGNNLRTAHNYDAWRMAQTAQYPSLMHIADGYFGMGVGFNNFVGENIIW